jgi:hypothetical protein
MKSKLPLALALAAMLSAMPALAAADADSREHARETKAAAHDKEPATERDAPLHSQQNKMKTCNSEAGKKNLKGDERRAFMSACLKG